MELKTKPEFHNSTVAQSTADERSFGAKFKPERLL